MTRSPLDTRCHPRHAASELLPPTAPRPQRRAQLCSCCCQGLAAPRISGSQHLWGRAGRALAQPPGSQPPPPRHPPASPGVRRGWASGGAASKDPEGRGARGHPGVHRASPCLPGVTAPWRGRRGGPWTQDGGPVGWPAAGDEALCAHSCRHGAAWRGWVPRRAHTPEPCSPPHHHHLPRSLVTRWLRAQRGFAAPETVGLFLAAFPAAACEYLQRARWADSTGSRPGSASPARPGAAPRGPAPAPGTGVGRGRGSPQGRSPQWGPHHGQGCPQLGPFPLSTMGPASLPRGTELTAALCSVCRQGGEGGEQL